MTMFQPAEIDRAAEQAVADLRALAAVWHKQGAAALDAAMRQDPSFAVRDTRRGGQGFVRPHVLYGVQASFHDIRFDAAAPPTRGICATGTRRWRSWKPGRGRKGRRPGATGAVSRPGLRGDGYSRMPFRRTGIALKRFCA
jgi:hypothetical protein